MDPKGKMDPKAPGRMADPNTRGPMPKIPAMLLFHVIRVSSPSCENPNPAITAGWGPPRGSELHPSRSMSEFRSLSVV